MELTLNNLQTQSDTPNASLYINDVFSITLNLMDFMYYFLLYVSSCEKSE